MRSSDVSRRRKWFSVLLSVYLGKKGHGKRTEPREIFLIHTVPVTAFISAMIDFPSVNLPLRQNERRFNGMNGRAQTLANARNRTAK